MKKIIFFFSLLLATDLLSFGSSPENADQLFKAASAEFDANRFESSLSLYLRADSAFVAEGRADSPEYAQSLHSTGRAYINNDDVRNGREYTRKAMELRERLFGSLSKEYITSFNNYALTYYMEGNVDDALKYMSDVVDLCKKMDPPHPDEGMYLINLGRVYNARKDTDSAVRYMEEALPKVVKFSDNYEYILNFLGNAYMEADDNANMNRIMGLMDEHNSHELEKECNDPECHLDRAEYYYTTGDPAHAKDEYMAVFAMTLTYAQKAEACRKYAQFLTAQRDFAAAGDYYQMASEALVSDTGAQSENSVSLLKQAGLCYFVGKEYDKAVDAHCRVIASVDKYGFSEKQKSISLQGLGNSYSAKKDYANSIVAFNKWIKHLEKNGHEGEADYAKAYERLASAQKFMGDYDESVMSYNTAIDLYGKLGLYDEQQQASDGLRMCLFYAKKDMGDSKDNLMAGNQRDEKTREIIRSSINTLEQGGDYLGMLSNAQSYATIAGAYAQLEDYANAISYYEKYIAAIRPALSETFLFSNPKERELTWRQELRNIGEMNALITRLPEDSFDLYARLSTLIYEGQLLSKGILLSSDIEFDRLIDRYGTKEMKMGYDKIKRCLADLERMRKDRRPTEEILKLARETDAMQLALARESAKYGVFTDFLGITADDVRKSLTLDDVAVEFVTLDTGFVSAEDMVAAVMISNEFPTGITVPVGTVAQIKSIINDNDKFNKDEYAVAVWGAIMQAAPDKKRVFFAPDGILNNIGIEYLTVDGKPMSEYMEMHRLSSTRELVRRHDAQPIAFASLFGDIDYDDFVVAVKPVKNNESGHTRTASDNFDPLENTGREVREICSILKTTVPESGISSYTGADASKAEFFSQKDIPVNLLHIATHGKYIDQKGASDADAMDRSILAFAGANLYDKIAGNEGIVTASEIAGMSLHDCQLAVLSACESGLGKLGGDGVFGLQRGFKNAGVKTLLVSLNEVADESTADMMIAFYRNLFDGSHTSMRSAFWKAQSEIRSKYPSDPTWGSFILIDAFN